MSLKILHTADWHLGQTFFEFDRKEEHEAFFQFLISQLASLEIDVLLISGDVFDVANPSAASQKMFFHFLKNAVTANPDLQIIITSGNHDSAARLEAPRPLLEEFNVKVIGIVPRAEIQEIDWEQLLIPVSNKKGERAWCLAIPFLRPGDFPVLPDMENTYVEGITKFYQDAFSYAEEKRKKGEAIITMGHLHATNAQLSEDDRSERVIIGGIESVPASAFNDKIAYTALGHIHKAQKIAQKENIRYAGSPLPMSFSEVNYKHQLVFVEIEGENEVKIEEIEIPKLIPLLCIPKKPKPLEEVLIELEQLPETDEATNNLAPYLEVRVLLDTPQPSLKHQIENILNKKDVRLAKITSSYDKSSSYSTKKITDFNDLQKMQPIDILKEAYQSKYNSELPKELEDIFLEACRDI